MVKLFSIKQEFSEQIFLNKKRVEFRRQNVKIKKDETCLIYTSGSIKKITGYFIVKEKIRLPINKLWVKTKRYAGITKKQFDEYFYGCKEGTAIIIKKITKFVKEISLNDIRKEISTFRPPQSYCNISYNLHLALSGFLPQKSLRHFLQI